MAAQYRWDDFLLDLDAYRLERAGVALALEPKAFNVLALMVRRPMHLFTKQEIFEAVWPDTAVTDHALTRVIAQLRRVLGDEAREARYIETVPTRGYRWIRPVEDVAARQALPEVAIQSPAAAPPPERRIVFPGLALAAVGLTILVSLVWLQRTSLTSATSREADAHPAGHDVHWPIQLTTHGGLDLHPALSPLGDAVAYVSDRSGALEIYVRALSGTSSETPLTSDGGQNIQPAWSPDGRFVAYHSSQHGGIWIVPARGGVAKQVAPSGSNPTWSPDGQRIAFQSDEHTDVTPSAFGAQSGSTIWSVKPDGSDLRELTRKGHPIGGHAAPAWSPDGRYLAFTDFEAGKDNGVWLLTLATGETKFLEGGQGLFELVFAPDNSALFVAGGEALIVKIPFDAATGSARGPRQLIPVAGVPGVRGLSISSNGRLLAFAGLALSSQIWAQPIARDGSAAGAARALTEDTSYRKSLADVSPDGSKVAYMSRRRGEPPNVWVMDVDGRNAIQLTAGEAGEFQPAWFPDGRRLAYLSFRGDKNGLWSVDLATRREELFFDLRAAQRHQAMAGRLKGRLAELQLAPSMTSAAFTLIAPPEGRRALYVTTVPELVPRAVSDSSISAGYPAWSPDEQRLAIEIKDGSSTHAAVIDLPSGTLRQLTNERGQTWVRSWSPDGRKIVVAALRAGVWSLRWIEVDTGAQGIMTPSVPPRVYMRYPEWSARGDLVVYERGELRGNIWTLRLP